MDETIYVILKLLFDFELEVRFSILLSTPFILSQSPFHVELYVVCVVI